MTDVFFLTVDSLRRDRFTQDRFSECWETFADEFVYFSNAVSNGVATPFAFPSIVTGHHVTGDGSLDPDTPTLAELTGGYAWAVTNNPHLCAARGYDRGFDCFEDDINDVDNGEMTTGILRTVKQAAGNVGVIKRSYDWFRRVSGVDIVPTAGVAEDVTAALEAALNGRSGLFWGHFMDPHYPFGPEYVPDRSVDVGWTEAEIASANDRFERGATSEEDCRMLQTLYDEVIDYLDRTLASFFESLRQAGRWKDSLVVVASDHGEAFGEHGVYNHMWDAAPIDELVEVPLLVKFPSGDGGKRDYLVQNADLFPTLCSALDVEVTLPRLTARLKDDTRRIVVSKSNTAVRVTTPDGYAIRRRDGERTLTGDVGDNTLSVLREQPIPAVERLGGTTPGVENATDQDLERRLEHLGYK